MKFYKHADGYFVIDNQIIPSGTCRLVFSDNTVKVVSIQTNKDVIENTLITSLEKENGTSYSSLSDLLADIGNFFVNAAQEAADLATLLNKDKAKWKTYKALLTQIGEDAPVARVLNQDEDDYLGDIVWSRDASGVYRGHLVPFNPDLVLYNLTSNADEVTDTACGYSSYIDDDTRDGTYDIIIFTTTGGSQTDEILNRYPIEIKVRQRGEAPVLLSAETNTTGDKVILTFDKKMSGYIDGNAYGEFDIQDSVNGGITAPGGYVDGNKIVINIDIALSGSNIECSYSGNINVESLDYGLLQPFPNFPVTNNVIPV